MGRRKQGKYKASSMTVQMMSNHMGRRLRVGLLPLYEVFLDFTFSGSVEYYRDNVSLS
jgi:hypothetical protein